MLATEMPDSIIYRFRLYNTLVMQFKNIDRPGFKMRRTSEHRGVNVLIHQLTRLHTRNLHPSPS